MLLGKKLKRDSESNDVIAANERDLKVTEVPPIACEVCICYVVHYAYTCLCKVGLVPCLDTGFLRNLFPAVTHPLRLHRTCPPCSPTGWRLPAPTGGLMLPLSDPRTTLLLCYFALHRCGSRCLLFRHRYT